jgi:hypothetical protein
MAQKAVSTKTDSQYESRAKTEAAVERIHGHFKDIEAAITREKAAKTSATTDPDRRQLQSALDALQLSRGIRLLQPTKCSAHPSTR